MVSDKDRKEESMKRFLWLAIATLLVSAAIFGGTITVTQPAGGNVVLGGTCPIAWTASGVTTSIKIQLVKPGGALVGVLANNLAAGASPWNWTVASPAVIGVQYKIRVRAGDGSAEGESALFTVVQGAEPVPGSISNVKLSGSSPYCQETNYTISWTVTGVTQHLKLELLKGGAVNSVIAPDMAPGTSSRSWTAAGAAASDYKVRVSAIGDPATGESAVFELKTCGGIPGLHPGNMKELKELKPGGISQVGDKFQGVKLPVVLPGAYQNYPCSDSFPTVSNPLPLAVLQQGWQQFNASSCGVNQTAKAGIYWFPWENIQVAAIYRSRIIFYLSEYTGQGAMLESAKLKMKRIHSIHEDANSGCGCSENLFVLMAPMNSSAIPDIGQSIYIPMGETEFSRDVTAIVKNWLDGAWTNNGLILLAGELPCSGGRRCVSCYEASLLLYMK
jgi:hypothetical protein